MIKTYCQKDIYTYFIRKNRVDEFEEHKVKSVITEDHEKICSVIRKWILDHEIELDNLVILEDLMNSEKYKGNLCLANDLSFKNCTLTLGDRNDLNLIRSSYKAIDQRDLRESYKIWEEQGIEKIFILICDELGPIIDEEGFCF